MTTTDQMTPEALDNWRMDEAINASKGNGFMGLMDAYRDLVRRDVRPAPVEDAGPDQDTLDARAVYAEFCRADSNMRETIRAGRYDSHPAIPRLRSAIREIKYRAVLIALSEPICPSIVADAKDRYVQLRAEGHTDAMFLCRKVIETALREMRSQLVVDFRLAAETENEK